MSTSSGSHRAVLLVAVLMVVAAYPGAFRSTPVGGPLLNERIADSGAKVGHLAASRPVKQGRQQPDAPSMARGSGLATVSLAASESTDRDVRHTASSCASVQDRTGIRAERLGLPPPAAV